VVLVVAVRQHKRLAYSYRCGSTQQLDKADLRGRIRVCVCVCVQVQCWRVS